MTATTDDKTQKRQELLAQLGAQAETLKTTEGWKAWLETSSKFHNYSVNNQLMIMSQRPSASKVAGFKTWQSMGRQVRKGEKGIGIFAPMVFAKKDENGNNTDEIGLAFRIVYVFDVAQTDGDPLPDHSWPVLDQEGAESLKDSLVATVKASGLEYVETSESANGARGWFTPSNKSVTIVNTYPVASQAKTLIHELAHSLDPRCAIGADATREERELVAESVAYIVSKRLGLDADECSTFYVASWGSTPKKLEQLAESVTGIAEQVESAIAKAQELVSL